MSRAAAEVALDRAIQRWAIPIRNGMSRPAAGAEFSETLVTAWCMAKHSTRNTHGETILEETDEFRMSVRMRGTHADYYLKIKRSDRRPMPSENPLRSYVKLCAYCSVLNSSTST